MHATPAFLLAALLLGGSAVQAQDAAGRREVLEFANGARVEVIRGAGAARPAEAPAEPPAGIVQALAGRTLWLIEEDRLTACIVRKTSYVDGYRIFCVDDCWAGSCTRRRKVS